MRFYSFRVVPKADFIHTGAGRHLNSFKWRDFYQPKKNANKRHSFCETKKKKENKINKPLDQQNLINECQQKVAAMKISIYLLELNVLLLFSAVDSLHLSFARSLVNRMQCCDKHRAKGFHFHVKHTHTHILSLWNTNQVSFVFVRSEREWACIYEAIKRKGWRWLSAKGEKQTTHWTRAHDEITQFSFAYNSIYSNKPSRYFYYSNEKEKKNTHEQKQPNGKLLLECQFTVHSNFGKL